MAAFLAATAGFVARVQPIQGYPQSALRARPKACELAGAVHENPASVVGAQLSLLQSGEAASLSACHTFMSPFYHERGDALERFAAWFESPVYEALLRCGDRTHTTSHHVYPARLFVPHPVRVH